jgi:hypothetical protein
MSEEINNPLKMPLRMADSQEKLKEVNLKYSLIRMSLLKYSI